MIYGLSDISSCGLNCGSFLRTALWIHSSDLIQGSRSNDSQIQPRFSPLFDIILSDWFLYRTEDQNQQNLTDKNTKSIKRNYVFHYFHTLVRLQSFLILFGLNHCFFSYQKNWHNLHFPDKVPVRFSAMLVDSCMMSYNCLFSNIDH